jgi:DNA-binding NtrC family response regulator
LPDKLRSITVLVVDDEVLIRNLLGDTLGALGYTTITAENYETATVRLKDEHIDVVITDIILPDESGMKLIKQVKSKYPRIPVLAISGKQILRQDVLDAGADGYLSKPFRIGVVEDLIQKTLIKNDIDKTRPTRPRKTILVVDDEPDVVSTLIESLEALGYRADGASNGAEGLRMIEAKDYDLVITDIRMPEKNGIELLKDIKKKFPSTKVVIITGYTLAYPPDQAEREGADGYIAKPFRINQIDDLLAKLLYNFDVKSNHDS